MRYSPALPWSLDLASELRFRRIVRNCLAGFVVAAILVSVIKPPPVERAEAEKLPPRLAKLIIEKKEAPLKPEPLKTQRQPKDKPEQKVEEAKVAEPVAAPQRAPAARQERERGPARPGPSYEEQVRSARETASRSGILVARDQLQALRQLSSSSLSQTQVTVGTAATERHNEPDLIAQSATAGSGGVAARGVVHGGGGSLKGRETTRVSGPSGAPSVAQVREEARAAKRTHEEIRLAFDSNKAAIYGIYNRALRQNPLLEGRVVFRLTIDPAGQITACSIVSSALNNPELESKLLARIQLINFGARPKVETWTGNYQIDFVPST